MAGMSGEAVESAVAPIPPREWIGLFRVSRAVGIAAGFAVRLLEALVASAGAAIERRGESFPILREDLFVRDDLFDHVSVHQRFGNCLAEAERYSRVPNRRFINNLSGFFSATLETLQIQIQLHRRNNRNAFILSHTIEYVTLFNAAFVVTKAVLVLAKRGRLLSACW